MKKTAFGFCLCLAIISAAGICFAESLQVPVNRVNPDGAGEGIGTVTFVDTPDGMDILVDILGLAEGEHGMHIHENPSCAPAVRDGGNVPALAAGGHWDPDGASSHKGPMNGGHKGDLPFITADASGMAKETLSIKGLFTKDIHGRSLMIHAGGDNYSDNPPLGGGGARAACGVIE